MQLAAIQHDIIWEQRDQNLARYTDLLTRAVDGGADVAVFTEMFAVGFSMNTAVTAEAIDGPTVTWMRSQAARQNVTVCGSVPLLLDDARPYNTFVLARADGTIDTYQKMHPFTYSNEHDHFAAGNTPKTVTLHGLNVGVSVCYDLRFAPLYWQRAHAVDVEIVVASWPHTRREHWMALARARAIENQTYMVAVNRVGDGGGLHYSGDSLIIDPLGEIVAQANDTETILTHTLDAARVQTVRSTFPVANDRRDTYPLQGA
jgi:predicted amidohydrolase